MTVFLSCFPELSSTSASPASFCMVLALLNPIYKGYLVVLGECPPDLCLSPSDSGGLKI